MSSAPGLMNRRNGPRLINIALVVITGFWIFCGWLLLYCGPKKFLMMAGAWLVGYKTLWKLPSSEEELLFAEGDLLTTLDKYSIKYDKRKTTISRDRVINAVYFTSGESSSDKKTLVCIHGLGAGLGIWIKNIPSLLKKYNIWCIDLLGFGLSSKDNFKGNTAEEASLWWTSSIKEWKDRNIPNAEIDLLGHSLGGFIAASYTLAYPDDVNQLLLAAPVGIISSKETIDRMTNSTKLVIRIAYFIGLSRSRMISLLGPFAHSAMKKILTKRRKWYGFDEGPLSTYVSHLQCAPVTGEIPLRSLLHPQLGWHSPLLESLSKVSSSTKIAIVMGRHDFTCSDSFMSQINSFPSSIKTFIMDNVGHHMYATHPEEFAEIVLSV